MTKEINYQVWHKDASFAEKEVNSIHKSAQKDTTAKAAKLSSAIETALEAYYDAFATGGHGEMCEWDVAELFRDRPAHIVSKALSELETLVDEMRKVAKR